MSRALTQTLTAGIEPDFGLMAAVSFTTGGPAEPASIEPAKGLQALPDILSFCAHFLQDPLRLARITRLSLEHPMTMPQHQHEDWLQLDIAVGCQGRWWSNGEDRIISGTTVAAFYPRQMHGYQLAPLKTRGELLSVKLRVNDCWPEIKARFFPELLHGLSGEEPLLEALRRLARMPGTSSARPPLAMVTLTEALCLWPRNGQKSISRCSFAGGGLPCNADLPPALRAVLELIEVGLDGPPGIQGLARQVHFSERHLCRRFRQYFDCTLHDYITSRRLARACELLVQNQLTVTQVARAVGFCSIHSFSRWFRQHMGLCPSQYSISQLIL